MMICFSKKRKDHNCRTYHFSGRKSLLFDFIQMINPFDIYPFELSYKGFEFDARVGRISSRNNIARTTNEAANDVGDE